MVEFFLAFLLPHLWWIRNLTVGYFSSAFVCVSTNVKMSDEERRRAGILSSSPLRFKRNSRSGDEKNCVACGG